MVVVKGRRQSTNVTIDTTPVPVGVRLGGKVPLPPVPTRTKQINVFRSRGWSPPLPEAVTEPAYTVMRKGMKEVYVRTKAEAERLEQQGWTEDPEIKFARMLRKGANPQWQWDEPKESESPDRFIPRSKLKPKIKKRAGQALEK